MKWTHELNHALRAVWLAVHRRTTKVFLFRYSNIQDLEPPTTYRILHHLPVDTIQRTRRLPTRLRLLQRRRSSRRRRLLRSLSMQQETVHAVEWVSFCFTSLRTCLSYQVQQHNWSISVMCVLTTSWIAQVISYRAGCVLYVLNAYLLLSVHLLRVLSDALICSDQQLPAAKSFVNMTVQ